MVDLKEKNVVITGGSSGIGRATALLCAQRGANVAIIGHSSEKVDETTRELKLANPKAKIFGHTCDVSDLSAFKTTAAEIQQELGGVDILINNAGFATYETFHELTLETVDRLCQVNYVGAVYACKLFLDPMMKVGRGQVINVASVAGRIPITPNSVYSSAKHGLTSLTDLLRCEYAPFGIKVSLILPGRVDTPFFDHETFKRRKLRPESKGMMKAEAVANEIIKMIGKDAHEVMIPFRFRPIVWLFHALPWFIQPLYWRLLRQRTIDHYEHSGWPKTGGQRK